MTMVVSGSSQSDEGDIMSVNCLNSFIRQSSSVESFVALG